MIDWSAKTRAERALLAQHRQPLFRAAQLQAEMGHRFEHADSVTGVRPDLKVIIEMDLLR